MLTEVRYDDYVLHPADQPGGLVGETWITLPIVIDPRAKNDPELINIFMMLTGAWSDGSPAPLS